MSSRMCGGWYASAERGTETDPAARRAGCRAGRAGAGLAPWRRSARVVVGLEELALAVGVERRGRLAVSAPGLGATGLLGAGHAASFDVRVMRAGRTRATSTRPGIRGNRAVIRGDPPVIRG